MACGGDAASRVQEDRVALRAVPVAAEDRPDLGSVLLRAVAMIPESQLWTLQEPDRSRIARGLAWAATTERKESSLDSLVKRSGKRRSQPVGRKK